MVRVSLYIYDISKGTARQLSLPLLGKQIDGVWHTSILCYGREYFFGSAGIQNCDPGGTILGPPDETVSLGETSIPKRVFHDFLAGLSRQTFRPEQYHLFNHNCNTFSNEIAQFLTGKKIPSYITDLPQEVMSTPFGAMIGQFFDDIKIQPHIVNGQGSEARTAEDEDYSNNYEQYTDVNNSDHLNPLREHSDSVNSVSSVHSCNGEVGLKPGTYPVLEELEGAIRLLKQSFEECAKNLDKLRLILEEVEFDFGNEDDVRNDITDTLNTMCKQLNHKNGDVQAFKSLLIILKATALHFSKIFKYAEGDEIVLLVINKLQRGNVSEIKLLRIQFLTNLLSVYELRNHLLGIESLCRTLVSLTVSSVLDGPGPLIREAGCNLAYSLSIVKLNDDFVFELSSALLHVVGDLDKTTTARKYCIAALKNFVGKSDQIQELAMMIVPDIYEAELKT